MTALSNTAGSIPPRSKNCVFAALVTGDYQDPTTFQSLRQELGLGAAGQRTISPPAWIVREVVEQLGKRDAHTALASSLKNHSVTISSRRKRSTAPCSHLRREAIFRIGPLPGQAAGANMLFFPLRQCVLEPFWNRHHVASVQITMAEDFRRPGTGRFFTIKRARSATSCKNHLSKSWPLTMEPPVRTDSESIRDEKVKVLRAIHHWSRGTWSRAVPRLSKRKRVAPTSQVETFAALQLEIDSWRWRGVPFYIRAGKCLPVDLYRGLGPTASASTMYQGYDLAAELLPFSDQPTSRGFGLMSWRRRRTLASSWNCWRATTPAPDERMRTNGCSAMAMAGDATLFAAGGTMSKRPGGIVDPVLKASTPV